MTNLPDPTEHPAPTAEAPEKSLERQIRAFHWVRLLAELRDRQAGGPGEHEAALRLEGWMREIGFDEVAITPVPGRAAPGLRLSLSLGLGAVAAWWGGLVGVGLAALALLSFRREERSRMPALSRWLPARDSVNVVARAGAPNARRRIVLSASIDAPRAGRIFGPGWLRRLGPRELPGGGALRWCERGLVAALVVAAALALGAEGAAVGWASAVVSLGLLLAAGLAAQWGTARSTPGANDASGVAAMLTCGEQLLAQLREGAELWLVGAGAGHNDARGLAAFVDSHADWSPDSTLFLHFDRVGGGSLHTVASEGALERTEHPPRLRELARRLALGRGFADVTPVDFHGDTDAGWLARHGAHVLALVALEDGGAPREDHSDTDLPDRLDMPTVVRAADFAAAVVVSHWRGEADPLAVI